MQPNPRTENAKKDKVAVIFDAACAVIREKGFHQARITDISTAANISYGLVYHYFKNKADLFDAIITEWWEGLFAMMDQCGNPSEPVEQKLGSIVKYFLDQYEHRPDLGPHLHYRNLPIVSQSDSGASGMVQGVYGPNGKNHCPGPG